VSTELADACGELGSWLAIAETLIAEPDIQPSARSSGKPTSRPPWNAAVAYAITDAHAGVRDIEHSFRLIIHGRLRDRGGSTANTLAALDAITAMESAVPQGNARQAARHLIKWATSIRQLPAIDDKPRWEKIRAGPDGLPPKCPHCQTFSLRVALESGVIQCWFPGCKDGDGNRPQARLDISRIDSTPVLVWIDGRIGA
jgi:hypothetical protein